MPGNSDPIYSKVADFQPGCVVTTVAGTPYDPAGTIGTDIYKLCTADATNGGFLRSIFWKYIATTTQTSISTILKIFRSTASSGATTSANTQFVREIALPATGTLTTTGVQSDIEMLMNLPLAPGESILVKTTVGQTANTGWQGTANLGKY